MHAGRMIEGREAKGEGPKKCELRKAEGEWCGSEKIFALPSLAPRPYTSPVLSLILPTYNEAENIPVLLPKIVEVLQWNDYEILVVDDDSPDRTWERALFLAKSNPRIRVLRRVGRRGLSSAVIEGFLAAAGDTLAVMDADGQHDLDLLPKLAAALEAGSDLAIGSRYIEGGSVGTWDERRFALSRMATRLAQKLCKVQVADPMSGFFMVKRPAFEAALPHLNPKGFKILLDLLLHVSPQTKVQELPFHFGERHAGESKLSRRVQIEFLEYLYEAAMGRFFPLSFLKFAIVGLSGVAINISVYRIAQVFLHTPAAELGTFSPSLIIAIEAAIIWNFLLNNHWTFSEVQLKGMRALEGFVRFNIACLFGALANVAVTYYLFSNGCSEITSLLLGAFLGMTWNYTMSRLLTWNV
jgi:dolichol-phosphate mannosyltransferase